MPAMQRLRRTYERMDAEIAKSGGRGCSARTSRSRSLAHAAIVRMSDLGQEGVAGLSSRPELYDAIRAHPAFKPTYYFGSLLTERFPHLRERQTVPLAITELGNSNHEVMR